MICPQCNGEKRYPATGTLTGPDSAVTEGVTVKVPCFMCKGHGHAPDESSFPWPYEGAPVYSREYELQEEGWRRVVPAEEGPGAPPAWCRFTPDEGQRKANVYGWRVRDLDRYGNVVRTYEPKG